MILAASTLLIGVSACSPLAQAPLVYTSKQAIGLDVSTTSTETPGLAISLGYKSIDAAYVPVAVAQPCDTTLSSDKCNASDIKVTPLTASTDSTDTKSPLMQIITQANTELKSASELLTKRQLELDEKTTKQNADKQLEATSAQAQATLASTTAAAAPPLPGADAAALAIQAKAVADLPAATAAVAKATAATKAAPANQQAVAEATIARDSAQSAVNNALATLDKANAQLSKSLSTKRQDAFSVYGTFDGGTLFSSDKSANLAGNKVFSTGVASQQLTEGIKLATCLDAANKATENVNASKLPDADKQKLILRNYSLCQPRTSDD